MLTCDSESPAAVSDTLESLKARLRFALTAVSFAGWVTTLASLSAVVDARRIHSLMRIAGRCVVMVAGIRLGVRGVEHLPSDGRFLLVCNHINMFDPMIVYAIVPRHIIAIEKASHFKWPLYGPMIRRWGNLPVDRRDPAQSRESLQRAVELLQAGTPVFIFPEGTRARSGRLGAFHKGGFRLALDARVPLIPVVFKGADRIFREGTYEVHPGSEEVIILPPVPLDEYGPEDDGKLADDVRALIEAHL